MTRYILLGLAFGVTGIQTGSGQGELQPVVEVQEEVYQYEPANNGAGPMWCAGSTCLVRIGEQVFASGIETLRDIKPLNNCRWLLFARTDTGWQLVQKDPGGRTREPCPLAGLPDGRLLLSVNPTLTEPTSYGGPAEPRILQFSAADPTAPFTILQPAWEGERKFTEHSYRSFAAHAGTGELILFQNVGYTHAEWTYRDAQGNWSANGQLVWPWGAEYDRPQSIRVCYPNVLVRDRAVHFCGVSDIVEPYQAWRDYKKELTGRDWDYDFRRLFYTWSDDITTGKFHDWVEVASRDKTAGRLFPQDLWVAADGRVHLLWTEQAIDVRLRDKFFPDARQSHALNYAVLHQGNVVSRRTLMLAKEDEPGQVASAARFQLAPGNRLFVVYYVSGTAADGQTVSANRVLEITSGTPGPPATIPLDPPFTSFFTATVRAGSPPSRRVELLGQRAGQPRTISYARVRLVAE